ncbi:hypothetical protein P4C99_19790 [Pontiellaceae bacterium B1224]|nr:hypothetical protein [Pontiellaceae bacterium B1224]
MNRTGKLWNLVAMWFLSTALAAMASGRISTIDIDGDFVDLTIETVSNVSYQIQYTTNLTLNSWASVGDEFTATDTVTLRRIAAHGVSCWYRVLETMTPEVRASGRISGFSLEGESIGLTIETISNVIYQVQYSTSLLSDEWQDEGEEFMAAATSTVRTVNQHGAHCLYRVVAIRISLEDGDSPPPPPPPPPPPF